ncbi:CUB and sushi domain-containing protein 1-like [Argiope bruennichi]|uniref:CUB and sushi domain-containing protein 1 n=1 Tax=Argiope bruennichi TaxID=94029 RepID=A0A8T0F1V1_ARGBR|nr:CUB and sushi domain-containing protein 1-like [Argiope bruennichi]KAF8784315.1 CUB and sushi domain-containing protein 1 [Argiope bruennichi]
MISVACFLLAFALADSGLVETAEESTFEDCGDVQYDVENGMIRLPDFSGESIRDLNCSWSYTAPAGRKLLIKVDSVHLPPLELRTSQFKLYIDDTFYDIPRNCVKCLREMVAGKVLNVIFTSYVSSYSESHIKEFNETSVSAEGIGSFQIRYKAFDPHRCGKPEQIENGHTINKGRKVGQSVFYHCNPPYDLIGDSELHCIVTDENPVPAWSSKVPKCVIQDCTEGPVVKHNSHGAIASPGYPTHIYQFNEPCIWEIIAQPNQQIKVSITYLKFPKRVNNSFSENMFRLSLLDGDSNKNVLNFTESISSNNPVNFTTLTNKLNVEFVADTDRRTKEEAGFYLEYSFVSNSCSKPKSPENGEVIAYSTDLGSTVTYRCRTGFILVGELNAECLFNRQWSHPTPSCEPINGNLPPFITASNDSDTVTDRLSEIPSFTETAKLPKVGKKKATEIMSPKEELNLTETKEKLSVPKQNQLNEHFSSFPEPAETNIKKSEKDSGSGPKSEPHLLQVIPPKDGEKKSTPEAPRVHVNSTNQPLPPLDKGYAQEIDLGGLKLNLMMVYLIGGAGIPLLLIFVFLIVILIYRRKYPVRMRFGRKFSTFENPMYVTKDAQHPRELKRLTT